jgi:hypothetical protein
LFVGFFVGIVVGNNDGFLVGAPVGRIVGIIVGNIDGLLVGT